MKISTAHGIWSFLPTHAIVIPTNAGWRADGSNVTGAGLAKQAAERFPDLPAWYGLVCRREQRLDRVPPPALHWPRDAAGPALVLVAVKPCDLTQPHLSWDQPARLELVERGLFGLQQMTETPRVAVPLLGCGNGGLDPRVVLPLMRRLLDDRFLLVDRQIETISLNPLEGGPEPSRNPTTEDSAQKR